MARCNGITRDFVNRQGDGLPSHDRSAKLSRSAKGRSRVRPNLVLIDFESVQPTSLAALAPDFFA